MMMKAPAPPMKKKVNKTANIGLNSSVGRVLAHQSRGLWFKFVFNPKLYITRLLVMMKGPGLWFKFLFNPKLYITTLPVMMKGPAPNKGTSHLRFGVDLSALSAAIHHER